MSKDNMHYETTGNKVNKSTAKHAKENELRGISFTDILWVKSKQHKFGLSVTLNIVFGVFFFIPWLPSEIIHLISSI